MFNNYLKIAFRNINRQKAFSFINIFGLAVGMASCILILLWVQDELSYDRFHKNVDLLYRAICEEHDSPETTFSALTPPPLAPALKKDFPEIICSTRFGTWGRWLVKYGDKKFSEPDYQNVDPDFFEMFTIPFVQGDPKSVFSDLYSVVITEETAGKYFGDDDPMGKTLTINNRFDVKVTGVIKNIPGNSSLKFDFLSPFDMMLKEMLGEETADNWRFNSFNTYIMLGENSSIDELTPKLKGFFKKYEREDNDEVFLQPFKKIHLYSNISHDLDGLGDIKYVNIFSLLALFVLLIACINFMNLATARSAKRAKEVGLRKVVGANRSQIVKQFFGESMLMAFMALLLALVLVEFLLPLFNGLSGKQLSLEFSNNKIIYLGFLTIAIITGLLSGSYPALFLSSFQPLKVLKASMESGSSNSPFRKVLVTAQFTLTIILIIGAVVVSRQLNYMIGKELGYNKEHIVYVRMPGNLNEQYQSLKNAFKQIPGVENVTASLALPTDIGNSPGSPEWEGKAPDNNMQINADFVDYDYIETFKIEMAEGRSFSREFSTDDSAAYIVNEEAVRRMGLEAPLGKRFSFWEIEGNIVGVMKDFHFQPLHKKIKPIVFKIFPDWFRYIYARVKPGSIPETLSSLERAWEQIASDFPFEYHFLDQQFDRLYLAEQRMGMLITYFAALAILIACLGLFGLASYMSEQRRKEIGVRKVLGATVTSIIHLLSKEFIKWVLLANLLAWPISWFIMFQWLHNFAYRIDIEWWIFALAGGLALSIAIATVSFQAIKAALSNPVKALRYE